MAQIIKYLYLGSCNDARVIHEKIPIWLVVNATTDVEFYAPAKSTALRRVPIEDSSAYDLTEYLSDTMSQMDNFIKNKKNVFVHCKQGISRSASLVIAYLMKYQNLDLKSAYELVKEKRPIVRPNLGFFIQLTEFEKIIHPDSISKIQPWDYMGMAKQEYEKFIIKPTGNKCSFCTYINENETNRCSMCNNLMINIS